MNGPNHRLAASAATPDLLTLALIEIDAAIAMVVTGAAVRVRLCAQPEAEHAALTAAARAQAAGVAFHLRRDSPSSVSLVIGPRLPSDLAEARSRPAS